MDPSTGVAITEAMLKPVVDGMAANVAVIVPVGIIIFSILLGVGMIPAIIKKFANV